MTTLQQRISELFKENQDKRPVDLARYLGISRSSVSAWMTGTTKTIENKNAYGVAAYFNVNPKWVMLGVGKKNHESLKIFRNPLTRKQHEIIYIPLIDWNDILLWLDGTMIDNAKEIQDWFPCQQSSFGPSTFALRVDNDAMTSPYPGQRSYPEGGIIYVDPDKELKQGCRVVVRLNDGSVIFREYRADGNRTVLKSLNPQYASIEAPSNQELEILGVVTMFSMPE